jgi:hypothetical protein
MSSIDVLKHACPFAERVNALGCIHYVYRMGYDFKGGGGG